jgi:predicted O-linked N-acetylglucosamine transferase (SPINDLY family)/predicted SAM-dependent methyltransferase
MNGTLVQSYEDQFDIGVACGHSGDHDGAIAAFSRQVRLRPNHPESWCNLGYHYLMTGCLSESRRSLRNAVRYNSSLPQVWNNLGNVALFQGRVRGAVSNFKKALAVDPTCVNAKSNLLLALHSLPPVTPEEILNESRSWEAVFSKEVVQKRIWTVPPHPDRRLRVGVVSSDLMFHPVAFFLEPFLRGYDRQLLEVICYADVARPDDMTQILTSLSEGWRNTYGASNIELADVIRQDRVDILIDLCGHTDGDRLGLFCLKPAPLQVSWLGYPGTTGLSTVDYRLTDSISDPPGLTEQHYSELLLRLPGGFLCYNPIVGIPHVVTPPFVKNGFITFGSFNNYCKINRELLSSWIDLLEAVPNSRLFFKNRSFDDEGVRNRLVRMFRRLGGNPERLILTGQAGSFMEHLSSYDRVDIALDTFPYNGTTTTCEALWMGVPVVTLAGARPGSRVGADILSRVGLECCIAKTLDEYVQRAVALALESDRIMTLRTTLRTTMEASPLCDSGRFCRDIENAFRTIWRKWCTFSPVDDVNAVDLESHRAGLDLLSAGDLEEAERRFRVVLELNPESAELWSDLGIAVFRQGRRVEAVEHFWRGVTLNPGHAKGWANLGNALKECGRFQDAVSACRRAIEIEPTLEEGRDNLGASLLALGDYGEAIRLFYSEALRLSTSSRSWMKAGEAYQDAGFATRAATCFRKALSLDSKNPGLMLRLGYVLLGLCKTKRAADLFRQALASGVDNPADNSALLMSLNYLPDAGQEELHHGACQWREQHGVGLSWMGSIDFTLGRKLRIGYVSPDFHHHPVGTFLRPALMYHDRDEFEIYCYANSYQEDEVTAELKSASDCWRIIAEHNDHQAAEMIRRDRVDILIDLSGHTGSNRLTLFAHKPAPIQVSWLGYCHTTGITGIDYLISDGDTTPIEEERYYSEQVVRLPNSRFCYLAPQFIPDVEPLPFLENDFITFGSFNNVVKVNDDVMAAWAGVLHVVPGSRLILKGKSFKNGQVRRCYRREFERHGIDPSRVEFRGSSPHFLMMTEYGDVDIVLDTFPFTGGLTTCESLWMGVPVVTLSGDTPISRQSASFLRLVGLESLIAGTVEEYVEIARRLAESPQHLANLRESLRLRMAASPLCDGPQFAYDLETAFREMWRQNRFANVSGVSSSIDIVLDFAVKLFIKERFVQAEGVYRDVLEREPEHPRALHGLGMVFARQGKTDEGIALLEKALRVKSGDKDAYFNLAALYKKVNRLSDSEGCYQQGLELDPADTTAVSNLAGVLWAQGRIDESKTLFRQVLTERPDFQTAKNGYMLCLNYSAHISAEEVFREHLAWGSGQKRMTQSFHTWLVSREERRRLRIGYVSADLGHHPVGYFIANPLRFRDRSRMEVYCYSNRISDDELTSYFKEQCEAWRPIHGISDEDVVKMIRRDRIDILVDLSGHTGGNRLGVFVRRPAPIQVSWLGYPNTTGLSRIQYRFTDAIADPPGTSDLLHAEQLVRLPGGFLSYFPTPDSPEITPLPALTNGHLTFGSFNNLAKITPEVVAVWSRILKKLPLARLIMKRSSFHDTATRGYFRRMFVSNGVSCDRVELLPSTDTHSEHLKIYDAIDIALDTFPYNGTTTTCEALWMGVPVIVLRGDRHAGRVGASILSRVGLDEFIAEDTDAYVLKIVALAQDHDRLAFLRETLRDRMVVSPLCDGPGFSRILENAYRVMWKKWCQSSMTSAISPVKVEADLSQERKLHIGGIVRKNGWEIINAIPADCVDHLGDASDLTRFADSTFTEIYASHVLEHFDYHSRLLPILKEWFRVLKPGGSLSVSVPDMDVLIKLWGDKGRVTGQDKFFIMQMMFGGHLDVYDYHYAGFNGEILGNYLENAGFIEIRTVSDFDFIFEDMSRMEFKGEKISLNMVGRKPPVSGG